MTTKYLITTSIFALISVSAVQAADVVVPEQPVPVIAAPSFSWSGFYLGGQIGNFSSKINSSYLKDESIGKWIPIGKEFLPKLSGFVGGIYAGYNVDIDNGFIIGIDTDVMWSDKKDKKDIKSPRKDKTTVVPEELGRTSRTEDLVEGNGGMPDQIVHHTLKQKWSGATRVRIGFSADHIMPYVAGGVAYTQLRNIYEMTDDTTSRAAVSSDLLSDEKKKMVGYTLGGGIDFAMTNNFIVRAEYRYSDYGKKKFANEKVEIGYKTNDFRVGVAYKF
ncbi:outer membrane protein [Bartonella heixiaziensis]|uniref:outer membrane protein n=1 Tax=Bartonella heixiaziensis TaxID=1461000 RepID=UPI003D250ECF